MEHQKIHADEIVDRYVLGQLSTAEEESFEKHFFSCDQCFAEVQKAEKVIRGIQNAAARGVLLPKKKKAHAAFDWVDWLRTFFSPFPSLRLATAVLVLALIYPAYRGIVTVSQLQDELAALRQPQANAQTYALQTTRSGGENLAEIPLADKNEIFVLTFTLFEKNVAAPQYRAEIVDHDGKTIWQNENLQPLGEYEVFTIACRRSFFHVGSYTLKVYEINPADRQIAKTFQFSFALV